MNTVCPQCHAPLTGDDRQLRCANDHSYPVRDGLPILLVPSEGWDNNAIAAEFEAKYKKEGEPWQYSKRGAELLKYRFIEDTAKALLGGLSGKHVIDIGCSVGGVTAALGAHGAELLALDISPTAVARARTRLPSATYCVASSTRLPVGNATADLAILSDGIRSWQLTPEQVAGCLAETARVLKPGAKAMLLDYMHPRFFDSFIQSIDRSAMRVEEVAMLGDRLYYTVERLMRDLRLPTGVLASEGLARGMRALSKLGGQKGSKHICVIAQAR